IVNPNNPDGRAWSREALIALAAEGWLILDESFVEAAPGLSVADLAGSAGFERLIVLRSFGKFYGLPGVRLGFVVGAAEVVAKVRAAFGDWPVCADAIALGTAAYADAAWRETTLARLTQDAARLDGLLVRAGFAVVGGAPLFRLAEVEDAEARFVRLAERGVLVRPFAEAPRRLRFGLPPAGQWDRLAAALEACA